MLLQFFRYVESLLAAGSVIYARDQWCDESVRFEGLIEVEFELGERGASGRGSDGWC